MGWASMGATVFHFIVSMVLYLFAKMLRTQAGSYFRAVSAMVIAVVDGSNVVVALVLLLKLVFLECNHRRQFPCVTDDADSYQDFCVKQCNESCWNHRCTRVNM